MTKPTIEIELWRPIPGHEGHYEASSLGRIRSLDRVIQTNGPQNSLRRAGRVLRAYPSTRSEHLKLKLYRDGKARTRLVHQLVLEAFVGPRPAEDMDACHNDGDALNNRLENLRWDTKAANAQDRTRHGTQVNVRKTECVQGHPFNEINTYLAPNGTRKCRTCRLEATRKWRARRSAA